MTAAKKLEAISVEDYLTGEDKAKRRHEYVAGNVYAMAGGRNQHNQIATNFLGVMFAKLRGKRCKAFNSDTKARIRLASHTRFYYPDGMIVCDGNPGDDTYQDRPVVIAEVMSTSTRRTDEGEKLDAYLTISSLTGYLLIESTKPQVTVHRRVSSGFVAEVYEGLTSVIPLEAINEELALAELYEGIDFAQAAKENKLGDDWEDVD